MAAFPMPTYYRPSALTVNTQHHDYFGTEEDENSILDDNILDHSGLDSGLGMSPPMPDGRRDSFAVFSPKSEDWQHATLQSAVNPYAPDHGNHSNNPFLRLDSVQAATYGQQSHGWPLSNGSGTCTPIQGYDGLPAELHSSSSLTYAPMAGQIPFGGPGISQVSPFPSAATSNSSYPGSPQNEWKPTEPADQRLMQKRVNQNSPGLRSHSPLLRRDGKDGIRKKNARFEIPAERNLLNIDQLIAHCHDEQQIKELKQQKRLLRNRQAA